MNMEAVSFQRSAFSQRGKLTVDSSQLAAREAVDSRQFTVDSQRRKLTVVSLQLTDRDDFM
jgi:hypothetical protein